MGGRAGGSEEYIHPTRSERREHSPSNSWACEERGVTDTCFVVVRRSLITNHACNARVSAMHAERACAPRLLYLNLPQFSTVECQHFRGVGVRVCQ